MMDDKVAKSGDKPERVPPLLTWMFQKVFGSEDSRDVAKALVNAVLDGVGLPKIKEIDEVKAEAAIPHSVSLRSPRTDVLLVSGDRLIDVEPQLYKTEYENKALYYAASLLVSHVGKGANGKSNERDAYSYSDFPQTVVIMFIKGRVKWPNSEQFVTVGRLHWELDGGFERGKSRLYAHEPRALPRAAPRAALRALPRAAPKSVTASSPCLRKAA